MKPKCFNTDHEWLMYIGKAELYQARVNRNRQWDENYCRDCKAGYQAKMKEQGRCERPEIKFKTVSYRVNGETVTEVLGA